MGLAPYGRPLFKDLILEHLLDLKEDGSFRMDMSYFNYCHGLTMTSANFHRLFGGPPRQPETELTQREMDLAASIQAVTEEIMLRTARHVHRTTKLKNLVLAGGVALNCVGNGRHSAGRPLRADLDPARGRRRRRRPGDRAVSLAPAAWKAAAGPARATASKARFSARRFPTTRSPRRWTATARSTTPCADDEQLVDDVASLLAEEKVVGWFQGRMEFGPRALGRGAFSATPAVQRCNR